MQLDRPFLAITPTVDGDVLAALARVQTSLSVSQLQRVIGRYSLEGLRKALHRLVEQGIVRPIEVGNSVAYALNREHLVADAVVSVAEAKSRLFERIEQAFQAWPDEVRYAAVFGSASRGAMVPESDIDLVLVHDDATDYSVWEANVNDLVKSTFLWTGNWMAVITMSVRELQERWLDGDGLVRSIRDEGLTVRGTREWFEARLREVGRHANA